MHSTKFLNLFVLITVLALNSFGQSTVKISEDSWTLPTYKVKPAEKAPIFYTGESFQGARRVIYPYALNDIISDEKEDYAWKTLMLENEYIKLCITTRKHLNVILMIFVQIRLLEISILKMVTIKQQEDILQQQQNG